MNRTVLTERGESFLEQKRREFERRLLKEIMTQHHGHCGRTARHLGVHRNTVTRMMEEAGLTPQMFRLKRKRRELRFIEPLQIPVPKVFCDESKPTLQELVNEREGFPKGTRRVERMLALADPEMRRKYLHSTGRVS